VNVPWNVIQKVFIAEICTRKKSSTIVMENLESVSQCFIYFQMSGIGTGEKILNNRLLIKEETRMDVM
jgi:hypothetical protein